MTLLTCLPQRASDMASGVLPAESINTSDHGAFGSQAAGGAKAAKGAKGTPKTKPKPRAKKVDEKVEGGQAVAHAAPMVRERAHIAAPQMTERAFCSLCSWVLSVCVGASLLDVVGADHDAKCGAAGWYRPGRGRVERRGQRR